MDIQINEFMESMQKKNMNLISFERKKNSIQKTKAMKSLPVILNKRMKYCF